MAPKQRTTASADAPSTTTSAPAPVRSTKAKANNTDAAAIAQGIWDKYVSKTPQRTKLLDTFLAFLVIVGALQFLYVVLVGNFVRCLLSLLPNVLHHACKGTELEPLANNLRQPFNAFLSGFSATVGQFVLTASLRIQTNSENKVHFENISHERAFADFILGSLLLHFFCVNFIN
jgi:oligosaccharyltransferase complex subunit epsilon